MYQNETLHSSSITLVTLAEITNLLLHQLRPAPNTTIYENINLYTIYRVSQKALNV